jgi:hypothetical protein
MTRNESDSVLRRRVSGASGIRPVRTSPILTLFFFACLLGVIAMRTTAMAWAPGPDLHTAAGDVQVNLSPSSSTVARDQIFTVDLQIVAGAQSIDGAEVHLYFDQTYLQVVDVAGNPTDRITNSGFLTQVLRNRVYTDSVTAHIHFAAGVYDPEEPRPSGTFPLATIRFKALWGTGGAATALAFGTELPYKTDVTSGGYSVIGAVQNGSVTISGDEPPLTPTPTPTVTSAPGPTATASATPTQTPTKTTVSTPTASPQCTPVTLWLQQGAQPDPSYDGAADTYLNLDAATTAHGGSIYLQIKNDGNGGKRPLLRFDVGSIPAGSYILAATLHLAQDTYSKNTSFTSSVSIYSVVRHWLAAEATWYKATAVDSWATAGADGVSDRSLVEQGTLVIGPLASWQWRLFPVRDAVQAWVNDPGLNEGLLAIGTGNSQEFHFYSNDYPGANVRPKLEVVYCPGSAGATSTPTPTSPGVTGTPGGTPASTLTPTPSATATPTQTPTPTATATQVPVFSLEAELGQISAPMMIVSDPTASNGAFVMSPVSYSGFVDLSYYIDREGDYALWGRVAADSYGADSFWVTVDKGTEGRWDLPLGGWNWVAVAYSHGSSQPVVEEYHLTVGWHRVRVATREAGARLDVLEFRPYGMPPPPTATQINTPTPTPSATITQTPTATPTSSETPTLTMTPTVSPSVTHTATATPTGTVTAVVTPTTTSTVTATATSTPRRFVVVLPIVFKPAGTGAVLTWPISGLYIP